MIRIDIKEQRRCIYIMSFDVYILCLFNLEAKLDKLSF